MQKEQYKSRAGVMQWRPKFNKAFEREVASDNYTGFCLACGNTQGGCEPDARKYTCETCGQPKVYGLEELLVMGLVR